MSTIVPVGTVISFAGLIDDTHAIPTGFLVCDGSALSSATFATLYGAIGTAYGKGTDQDGVSVPGADFNLPELRGYFLRGVDPAMAVDKGTRTFCRPNANVNGVGTIEAASTAPPAISAFSAVAVGDHDHSLPFEISASRAEGGVNNTVAYPAKNAGTITNGAGGHGHTISGGDPETRPINAAVWWLICSK